jgi:hypothetical protein
MLYLDTATAANISLYQGELLQFRSDAVGSLNDAVTEARIRVEKAARQSF